AVTSSTNITFTELSEPLHGLGNGRRSARSFTLEAQTTNGQPVTQFALPYTMVLSYTDEELAALGVSEGSLNVAFWNGSAWEEALPCTGCGVDTANNRITVVLDHFTEFAVVATAGETKVFLPLVRR